MRFVPIAMLRALWLRQDGQDMIEYALIAGMIAVLAAASIPAAVTAVGHAFAAIVADLNTLSATVTTS
jgi:Flp pilus assembly pilin Flp